jgi:pilus assembly protein FimV
MAEEQLADLSGQVGNLRELVTIKDRQIAELQASLTAQQQAAPAADQSNGFNWLVSLVVGVVLGALALLLGLRLRQRRQAAEPSDSNESIEPPLTSIPDVSASMSEPVSEDDSAPALDGVITEALAEAEIYISYGRHQQALNILLAAADKSTGPAAAEAYCKMIEIALDNDRRDEALTWLGNVKAQGSDEQIARASTAVTDSQEVDLPDLGDLVETEVFSTADQQASAEQPTGLARDGEIEGAGEPPVSVDTIGSMASEPTISQSEESEPLALEPEWQVDSRGEINDSFELDAIETDPAAADNDQESKLPPELAEVLGMDEAPPLVTPAESESEGLVYATETDPMDAKLDLARAYIDMGDEEGARPILEDVVTNGDLRQQAEARELLIHID